MNIRPLLQLIRKKLQAKSIQWEILRSFFFVTSLMGILTSLAWIYVLPYLSNIILDKKALTLLMVAFWALILPFLFSVGIGLSLSRRIRSGLHEITGAQQALSRGNNQVRLPSLQYSELFNMAEQFNETSRQTQKQVLSLQRLVNENARLIKNAEAIASTQERKKIARELHDAISQNLFALSTTMTAVKALFDSNPTEAKKYFEQIETMIHLTQQELRALIMHLRPVSLEGVSFQEGLHQLLDELQQKHPQIQFTGKIQPFTVPSKGLEAHLFRIVQEAISNVLRHAQASRVEINLLQKSQLLLLFIEDNGVGFLPSQQKKSSYGLSGMEERATEIGGRMDVYSLPGKGTRIEIRVPLSLEGHKEDWS